jgi:hypothetical protein
VNTRAFLTSQLGGWRKNGWLTTVNIAGRPYLTDKALADFMRRVEAGEVAKEPKVPNRRAAV